MAKSLKIFVILILAMAISGCAQNGTPGNKIALPDILLGQDCGMDKLQCCKTEPVCLYAQKCCVDPNNATRNYCSDQCTCGGKGEFCCKDAPKCQDGSVCDNGNCAECGKDKQVCCADNQCGAGLVCNDGKCTQCGVEGNICCSGNICLNQDKLDKTRTGCFDGTCAQCGAGGAPCPGEIKCISGYLNNNGTCYECGEANEPCCDANSGKSYDCNSKKYLHCYQGFCLE